MKSFLIKNLIFCLPLAAVILTVNWFGDAANLFSNKGSEFIIAKYLTEGKIVENAHNFNERLLQKYLIIMSDEAPEILVMGSSRVMQVGSTYSNRRIFNQSMAGCSVEDLIAVFQLYKEKNKFPDKIVIGMDPWFFNKNNNQNRWETLEPEFNSFFESNASSSIKWEEYQQLLSPSYFQSSLKILKERVGDSGGIMIQPLNNKDKLGDRIARLNDGTIYYDKKYRSASLSEIKERITTFISGDVYSLEDYENLSERDMQRFKILIEDILANDIELIFLMIPYPPRVYEYLVKDDRYRIIEQFEGWVREYAFEQGIPLTGSLNPLKFELKTDHFYDGMHLNEDGLAVLLEDKVF